MWQLLDSFVLLYAFSWAKLGKDLAGFPMTELKTIKNFHRRSSKNTNTSFALMSMVSESLYRSKASLIAHHEDIGCAGNQDEIHFATSLAKHAHPLGNSLQTAIVQRWRYPRDLVVCNSAFVAIINQHQRERRTSKWWTPAYFMLINRFFFVFQRVRTHSGTGVHEPGVERRWGWFKNVGGEYQSLLGQWRRKINLPPLPQSYPPQSGTLSLCFNFQRNNSCVHIANHTAGQLSCKDALIGQKCSLLEQPSLVNKFGEASIDFAIFNKAIFNKANFVLPFRRYRREQYSKYTIAQLNYRMGLSYNLLPSWTKRNRKIWKS